MKKTYSAPAVVDTADVRLETKMKNPGFIEEQNIRPQSPGCLGYGL